MGSHNPFPVPMNEVYKIAKKAMGRYLRNRVMNDDFDDLVQDTIIRAMQVINSFNPDKGSFSNFIYMQSDWVIWREKIHMQGKGRSEFLFSGSLDYKLTDNDENLTLGHTISVEEDLETEVDYEQKLQRIIDFMNPYERQLIYDYVIKEKSGSQLSREQKTPKSTINSRIHKLIEKLRRYINENNLR